jgi:hypothetical protein
MTRQPDVERVLEQWLVEGPTRMPDHFFHGVMDRVDRVPQRRFAGLARRFFTMPSSVRFAAIAATIVIAIGAAGAYSLVNSTRQDVGTAPVATPSPSPSPSGPPIADGTYAHAPLKVADLTAMINADRKLTRKEKTDLIDTYFGMKGGTTYLLSLDFHGGRWIQRQSVDGVVSVGSQGTYTFPDDHTLILQEACSCPPMSLRLTVSGDSFTLQMINPPTKEFDLVPVRTLFESGPYTRQP